MRVGEWECVCACACACARVRACVSLCMYVFMDVCVSVCSMYASTHVVVGRGSDYHFILKRIPECSNCTHPRHSVVRQFI